MNLSFPFFFSRYYPLSILNTYTNWEILTLKVYFWAGEMTQWWSVVLADMLENIISIPLPTWWKQRTKFCKSFSDIYMVLRHTSTSTLIKYMNKSMWKVYCSICSKQLTHNCKKTCGMGSDNSNMHSDLTVLWHSGTYFLYATLWYPLSNFYLFSHSAAWPSDQYSILFLHVAKLLAFTYEVLMFLSVHGLIHLI